MINHRSVAVSDGLKAIIRMELIQDLIRDDANNSLLMIKSQIEVAEKTDPIQPFVTKNLVETWLLSKGYRMILDDGISASIRHERERQHKIKNAGLLKRFAAALAGYDHKTRTELDERFEALAAINEVLHRENDALEVKKNGQVKEIEAIISDASLKAESILNNANESSRLMIADAKKEVMQAQRQLDLLKLELSRKLAIKSEMDTMPNLVEIYQKSNDAERQRLEGRINIGIENIKFKWDCLVTYAYDANRVLVAQMLTFYKEMILDSLVEYDQKFGREARARLVPVVIRGLYAFFRGSQKTLRLSADPDPVLFFTAFLTDYLEPLLDEDTNISEFILTYESTFAPMQSENNHTYPIKRIEECIKNIQPSLVGVYAYTRQL